MAACDVCGLPAHYREDAPGERAFCTYLCQRVAHGVAGRTLTRNVGGVDAAAFFDSLRFRMWGRAQLGRFPVNEAVRRRLDSPETWPLLRDLVPSHIVTHGLTGFEIGASGAELALAAYRHAARDAPFLPVDGVVLLKSTDLTDPEIGLMVNEVCTGVRAAALFFSGVSRAFVPVVDFFPCATDSYMARATNDPRLFGVQTVVENALHFDDAVIAHVENAGTTDSVDAYVRSMFAQVLCALEAAQHHLQFVHYDLHMGNVLAEKTHVVDGEVLKHTRHSGYPLFFDQRDTGGRNARIIDYGYSRANDPTGMSGLTFHSEETRAFDSRVDMRNFAFAFIRAVLIPRFSKTHRELGAVITGNPDIMRVLEKMIGLRAWKSLDAEGGEYHIVLPPNARLGRTEAVDARLALPATIYDVVNFIKKVGGTRVDTFVRNEIVIPRTDSALAPTVSEVLDDVFFDALRTRPCGDNLVIVDIGDVRRSIIPEQ